MNSIELTRIITTGEAELMHRLRTGTSTKKYAMVYTHHIEANVAIAKRELRLLCNKALDK